MRTNVVSMRACLGACVPAWVPAFLHLEHVSEVLSGWRVGGDDTTASNGIEGPLLTGWL